MGFDVNKYFQRSLDDAHDQFVNVSSRLRVLIHLDDIKLLHSVTILLSLYNFDKPIQFFLRLLNFTLQYRIVLKHVIPDIDIGVLQINKPMVIEHNEFHDLVVTVVQSHACFRSHILQELL